MKNILPILAFGFSLFIAGNAMAKFTYEGYLTNSSDNPLFAQAAMVRISVVPPSTTCILYMETHSILTDSKGFFSVQVGDGTDVYPLANSLDGVFKNDPVPMSGMSCSYTPTAGDGRRLRIEVDPTASGSSFQLLSGFVVLGKAPQAAHADAVGGFNATNFVRSSSAAPELTSAQVTVLSQLIDGTSSLFGGAGSNGTVTNVSANPPLGVSSGSTTPVISITQASGSAGGYLTSADWTTFNSKLGLSSSFTGDLAGTASAVVVAKIRGKPVSTATPIGGDVLKYDGSQYVPTALGDAASKNVGIGAGTVAAGDDSRIVNSLTKALPFGKAFLGDGGNLAVARNINLGDIKAAYTPFGPAFNIGGGCGSGDMIQYSSLTGDFSCQPFNLVSGQVISALGFLPIGAGSPLLMPIGSNTSPTYSFSGDSTTGIFSPAYGVIGFSFTGAEAMRITNTGNIGIGIQSPDSKLAVLGTMRATSISGSHFISSTNTIDFAQGNNITSTFNCSGNIVLQNMRNGGNYKIAIAQGSTTMCVFDPTLGGTQDAGGPITFKYYPANASRNASGDTTYELSRFGSTVYVKWMTMYP